MQYAKRFLGVLNTAEAIAAAIAYTVVAALLIGDVIGRELFGKGVFGAQKMAVYAAVIAGFIGLALATASNTQLRPAFLDWVFKHSRVDRIGDLLACCFYVWIGFIAVQFIQQSFEFSDRAAVLYWLLWPIQMVIPYALFSTGLRHLLFGLWPDLKPDPSSDKPA